jgi:hypothetical protein
MLPDQVEFLIEEAEQCLCWAQQASTMHARDFFQEMASKYCNRAEGLIARSGSQEFAERVKLLSTKCLVTKDGSRLGD